MHNSSFKLENMLSLIIVGFEVLTVITVKGYFLGCNTVYRPTARSWSYFYQSKWCYVLEVSTFKLFCSMVIQLERYLLLSALWWGTYNKRNADIH